MDLGSRLLIAVLALLHRLPARWIFALGAALGTLLRWLVPSRRRIAARNLELCFPEWSAAERERVLRQNFRLLGRSILERSLLWHAPAERLLALTEVVGDIGLAERGTPVMWVVPHFMGLEAGGPVLNLKQSVPFVSVYQPQRSPAFDAALRAARVRFGGEVHPRTESARKIVRAVRSGAGFVNLPDQDFGHRDADFIPFFGIPAATLLAPSRMARALGLTLQPMLVEMVPQGWRVHFLPPLPDWPTDDPHEDMRRFNAALEGWIRRWPEQYLWVHKRFKTRPEGEASLYARGTD